MYTPTQVTNSFNKTVVDKNLCPFCFKEEGHFSRHLFRRHSGEEIVKKILRLPLKSCERRLAIVALRRKGNFILKQQRDILKTVRTPFGESSADDYTPCSGCLGYIKKSYLWRHAKVCKSTLKRTDGHRTQHRAQSQTLIAATGLLGDYLNTSRIRNEVFDIMHADNISFVAKTDPLICIYGETYICTQTRKQMNVVVSNRMREMANLKIALKSFTNIDCLIDILKVEHYPYVVTAIKIVCGYNQGTKSYKSPSTALHFGTRLKTLCDVAKKAVQTKHPLFSHMDKNETVANINEMRDMIKEHWRKDVSSLALKSLNQKNVDTPKLLPLTEDVMLLNKYITNVATEAFDAINREENIRTNYRLLCESTLVMLLIFNRKRIGEVQFLEVKSYKRCSSESNQAEFLASLTEMEKVMSSTLKRVVVFGKGSKQVAILFTRRMQELVNKILEIRKKVVPEANKYVFALPGSSDRWINGSETIRKFASRCGAKNPELLTSNRFRKQIATILQLMNIESDEIEQIARFMGHTEKTHREFYR